MSGPRRLASRLRGDEAGVTLVELICAIVILGITFVAILSAMGTAIIVSDVQKRQATAETILGSWAETLKARAYSSDPGSSYNADQLGVPVGSGYTAQPASVQCDGNLGNDAFDAPYAPPCPANGLQQVTLTVTSARGVSKSTSLLKRGT